MTALPIRTTTLGLPAVRLGRFRAVLRLELTRLVERDRRRAQAADRAEVRHAAALARVEVHRTTALAARAGTL